MNREIKFRQWNNEVRTFHYWGMIRGIFVSPAIITNMMKGTYEERVLESQQFTGLKDKNGKEIYEGDIVRGSVLDRHLRLFVLRVGWVEEFCSFGLFTGDELNKWTVAPRMGEFIEVIGNIYQDKHLLENK